MSQRWTGGQYSLYRAAFGTYLFVHFVQLVPWGAELFSSHGVLAEAGASPIVYLFPNILAFSDGPVFVTAMLVVAAALSVSFAMGWHDRFAALLLWYTWACLLGRNPLISNPGIPYIGVLLLAHLFIPRAPFGSWAARRRVDPGGGWYLPSSIHAVAWILMSLGYTYSGYTKLVSPSWVDGTALARVLENPLARPGFVREALLSLPDAMLQMLTWGALAFELLFAPLALFRRLRPWIWLAMVMMHLSLILVVDFADLSLGMVVLHLFTFDPAWVRPLRSGSVDRLFYDGTCGMCHSTVRFLLAEDASGTAFRFAPLDSDSFRETLLPERRAGLPDSVVLLTDEGTLLVRSRAILCCMKRLGGAWRAVATALGVVPAPIADWVYDRIAAVRYRLFRRPTEACPILPPQLRERFDN